MPGDPYFLLIDQFLYRFSSTKIKQILNVGSYQKSVVFSPPLRQKLRPSTHNLILTSVMNSEP